MRIIDRDVHFFLVLISLQKKKKEDTPEDTIGNRHPLLRIALFVLVLCWSDFFTDILRMASTKS